MSTFKRKCRWPTCTALTRFGYCEAHQAAARRAYREQPERVKAQAFYASREWKRLAAMVRKARPICESCLRAASQVVDHRVPIAAGGAPLDVANLQALCARCHARKTASADGGFGNRRRASG